MYRGIACDCASGYIIAYGMQIEKGRNAWRRASVGEKNQKHSAAFAAECF